MTLLNVLYDQLDYKSGSLFTAVDSPQHGQNRLDWLEKGEWLSAAKRAGAEKIFFVDNNPLAVFAECGATLVEKVETFNKAWCLARPRILFLASPGEIGVYDLAQEPIDKSNRNNWRNLKHLKILRDLKKVAIELQSYHRDNIESGRLFAEKRFGDLKNRADKALIRDLKSVRRELVAAGLGGESIRFAHALIGRSIFIRYLEDRHILTKEYFFKIAKHKATWTDLLNNPINQSGVDLSEKETYFPRVLQDKSFTYTLFSKLAKDFNGDMFPGVEDEEQVVDQNHLNKILELLYGNVGIQKRLFFYSYRFDIIPLDLISSIYEEFYHPSVNNDKKKNKVRDDGAYYTPPVLVEFIISRVLNHDVLKKSPRIMDPACGSGIFLVEAFRRIVRYEWQRKGRQLTFDELRYILKNQIAGIEVNPEAARITAFSLYLSMLHYLDPPAIDEQLKIGNKLPNLIAKTSQSSNYFQCILPQNVFDVRLIEKIPVWKERFGNGCADIIVGNPPWGATGTKADAETKARQKVLLDWCESNDNPIGDKEPSQAFLWRALDLLKPNGKAGMLVSAGVLFKHGPITQQFRKQWVTKSKIEEVFNFSNVRRMFFKEGISPFIAIVFKKQRQNNCPVYYWSAKQSLMIKQVQSILFSKNDLKIILDQDLSDYRIWKLLHYGSYKDIALINFIINSTGTILLQDMIDFSCVGFKKANQQKNADWLSIYKKIKIDCFSRYGKFKNGDFEAVPEKVEHQGRGKEMYEGKRIVVKEAPQQADDDFGRIEARYETEAYAYNHSFHVIKLSNEEEWKYIVLIGILWSSFAKYYFFLTTSSWGLWHDKILIKERLQIPVIFDKNIPATKKIITIVNKLRIYNPQEKDIYHPNGIDKEVIKGRRGELERELDEAIFELYGLNDEQKDLIHDFCEVTLPFFYKPFNSKGIMKAIEGKDLSWIKDYIHIFCRRWNPYLGHSEEMRGQVYIGAHDNMMAVEFFVADKRDSKDFKIKDNSWGYVLDEIGEVLPQPMGISQIIIDGIAHIVSDSGVIIIKRNEKRFWTRSMAREDADTTICKRMQDTMPEERRLH